MVTSLSPAEGWSAADLKACNLTQAEYEMILARLGRVPNRSELAMFGVMWSEHCCYKNSRPLLKQFPTTGERILVGPGENAGVVDLGDGDRLVFKIESHNHPSAVEPFQGAATGVGGILRDIFTMGARPIAVLNSLRIGPLEHSNNRRLLAGIVSGIAHYGNCTGVPTVGGEVSFAPIYSGNPLVNAMALGLMETEEIVKAGASGLGFPVLYAGSTTGRDGMGGASFASAELTADSIQDRPAVQVGDPFLEKSLIEACLEAFKSGAVVAAQDMGAAGLTCSTAEMAAKGRVGVDLDLDLIPVRETGMRPEEFLLSESQERMLLVIQPARVAEVVAIFERWGLQAVVAGTIIAEEVVRIRHQGHIVAEVPTMAIAEDTPVYHRELSAPPAYAEAARAWQVDQLPTTPPRPWAECLLALLDDPSIASKRWIYRQYDHQVQNNTVLVPGGADAAVVRIRPQQFGPDFAAAGESSGEISGVTFSQKGVAATVDGNGRYVYLDPYEGAKAIVAEAARNLSCVGAEPLAVTDNLNFGSPEKPIGYWQLAEACRGIADACRELNTPVTGGNVSLYNETIDDHGQPQAIYPTPVIGMVGMVPDIGRVCGQGWPAAGQGIYLLGAATALSLGGSAYLATLHELVTGPLAPVDLALEAQVQAACRWGIRQGWLTAAHDCSDGGLAIALAEAAISGTMGATVTLPTSPRRLDEQLFGEGGARILVTVAPEAEAEWQAYLQTALPDHWHRLGETGGDQLILIAQNPKTQTSEANPLITLPVHQLQTVYEQAIPRRMQS